MDEISDEALEEFRKICHWTFEVWETHKTIFENSDFEKAIRETPAAYTMWMFSVISHEYSLLQIAKLHDPVTTGKSRNLSLNYIIEHGNWDSETNKKLCEILGKMNGFYNKIKPARDKVISHADYDSTMNIQIHGKFSAGEDDRYFECLEDFLKTIGMARLNCDFSFLHFSESEARRFMKTFKTKKEIDEQEEREIESILKPKSNN